MSTTLGVFLDLVLKFHPDTAPSALGHEQVLNGAVDAGENATTAAVSGQEAARSPTWRKLLLTPTG